MIISEGPMFAIPFLHMRLENWQWRKKVLLNHLLDRRTMKRDDTLDHLTTDYHYQFEEGESGVYNRQVSELFGGEIDYLMERANLASAEVIMSWFEETGEKDYHGIHNHGAAGFSSVVYVDYDPNVHQPTQFVCPWVGTVEQEVLEFVPPNVQEGDIIFFPSLISHYTRPNKTTKKRLILSFNLNCKLHKAPFEN